MKRRLSYLDDLATISRTRKIFSKIESPHRATIIGAVNRIIKTPVQKKAIMLSLEPSERIAVGQILSSISGNMLRAKDFI